MKPACLPGGGWCPRCGCPESAVIKVRSLSFTHHGKAVTKRLRRRECAHCGARFTTREEVLLGSVTDAGDGAREAA